MAIQRITSRIELRCHPLASEWIILVFIDDEPSYLGKLSYVWRFETPCYDQSQAERWRTDPSPTRCSPFSLQSVFWLNKLKVEA